VPSPLISGGLVFHLSCDSYNNAFWSDKSVNGNNATVNGAFMTQSGSAGIKFNGTNNWLTWFEDNPLVATPSGSYTIQFRGVFPTDGVNRALFVREPVIFPVVGSGFWMNWDNAGPDNIIFTDLPSLSQQVMNISYTAGTNILYTLVVENAGTGGSAQLYANTSSVYFNSPTTVPVFNAGINALKFGQGVDSLFNGSITDLVLYNRGLSSAEVISNYNQLTSSCL
jgi:hypothetical protein